MLRRLWALASQRLKRPHLLVPSRTRHADTKIAVRRVAHSYEEGVEALKNVTLDIHHGEFVCLLGPSGCGKTTLLYALAGQVAPSGGHISIDGEEVKGPSPDRYLMFQEPALFPWMTVKQNLVFALKARHGKRKAEELATRYLHRVQLDGFERLLPHQLSAGMRMRVSLARALAMDPAVLLMDEPFGALDAQTRAHMHQLLQRVWMETKKTVVFVTHDVREALVLGDRVVVMAARPGRVLKDLEVRLEHPRDPDDERLVELSRHIRQMLERGAQSGANRPRDGADDGHGKGEERAPEARVPPGAAHPVGAGV